MNRILNIFCLCLAMYIPVQASLQDVLDDIAVTLKAGNAKELAKFFDNSIEITILDEEDSYSKAQAELVLKDFFAKSTTRSFELIHQGSSAEGSKYAIGYLSTDKGKYRTYILMMKKNETFYIQELRFEEE